MLAKCQIHQEKMRKLITHPLSVQKSFGEQVNLLLKNKLNAPAFSCNCAAFSVKYETLLMEL